MNLLNDNYKHLKNDYTGSRKNSRETKIKNWLNYEFYDIFLDFESYDFYPAAEEFKTRFKFYNNVVIPQYYNNYKKSSSKTKRLIRELIDSREESNLLIAKAILENNEN